MAFNSSAAMAKLRNGLDRPRMSPGLWFRKSDLL